MTLSDESLTVESTAGAYVTRSPSPITTVSPGSAPRMPPNSPPGTAMQFAAFCKAAKLLNPARPPRPGPTHRCRKWLAAPPTQIHAAGVLSLLPAAPRASIWGAIPQLLRIRGTAPRQARAPFLSSTFHVTACMPIERRMNGWISLCATPSSSSPFSLPRASPEWKLPGLE
jgi:hypothetical protein